MAASPDRVVLRAVTLTMLAVASFFLALGYAFLQTHGLARHAAGYAWLSPPLLRLLGGNTLLLIASSLALRRAAQWLEAGGVDPVLRWLAAAMGLGVLFLAGQALAWRLLLGAGGLAALPQSGYFYLLTLTHALHLAAGLLLLAWVLSLAWRGRLRRDRPLPLRAAAIVWHTFDAAWVGLFLLLLLFR